MRIESWLPDADATEQLGQALARTRPAQALVELQGDLGAGKSTLARALLRALGVQGAIRSPTYTLVERYPLKNDDGTEHGEAWHLDLYRIGHAAELDFLGLDEGDVRLWLVEWPERGAGALPPTDLRVELAVQGQGRDFGLVALSEAGAEWLARLVAAGQLPGFPAGGQ